MKNAKHCITLPPGTVEGLPHCCHTVTQLASVTVCDCCWQSATVANSVPIGYGWSWKCPGIYGHGNVLENQCWKRGDTL